MPLNIVIAGAGIGGLAAAIGLAQNGHKVTVYERLQHSGGVGYSFHIMQNASRCLAHIGIDPLQTGAVTSVTTRHFKASDGYLIREIQKDQAKAEGNNSFTGFVSRGALSEDLTKAAMTAGAQIHNGVKVIKADTNRSSITLADGTEVIADLIIGADGIHSPVRTSFVQGEKAQPHCSGGQNAVRFLVPVKVLQEDPALASISPAPGASAMWFARDRRVIGYPIDFGNVFSIASAHPAALSDGVAQSQDGDTAASYSKQVSLQTVLDIHADFEPRVQGLLKLADPEGFRVWKLEDLDDIGAWSSGHTTLLGDACHATLPSGFSGAAMAIEDGVTLAVLFDRSAGVADIEARLAVYERIRKPRVARVREFGRNLDKTVQSDQDVQSYVQFISGYDAVKEAQQALKEGSS